MADEVDVGSLTADQQLALQQFTAVTDQELKDAVPLLQRCQWNVQIAIARFFDGEPAEDPVAAAAAAQPPSDTRRAENLMNGFGSSRASSSSSARRVRIEAAPRVVPQPESQVDSQAPLVFTLLWAPVGLLYSLLARYFRFVGYLLPFIPRAWGRLTASNIRSPPSRRSAGRRPLSPRDTAARFIREFSEEYGPNELPFHEGGYASAFDLAKKELKFLLVVLVSPEHDLTAPFITNTLLSPDVVSFVRDPANNMLLWAGSVADSEPYSVSAALNCTKHPFSALIVHTPSVSAGAMGIAARLAGPVSPSQYLAKLRAAMSSHAESLNRVRAQRAEQNASRSIRVAQDSAYERSLATDRERKRKAQEAEAAAKAAEKAAQDAAAAADRYAANLAAWKRHRAARIGPEPSPDADPKQVVRISIRMPDAQRVVRRFNAADGIEEVYAFVECYPLLLQQEQQSGGEEAAAPAISEKEAASEDVPDESFKHDYAFRLVSPMPREVFDLHQGGTVGARIGRSGNLIVEMVGEGEDDDDDDEDDAEG